MRDGYLFIILLALTVATVAGVLVQVLFGLLEVKKRRLQERLGAAPETRFEPGSSYGPIAMEEKAADLTGMLSKSQTVQAFHTKLSRAFPGVVDRRSGWPRSQFFIRRAKRTDPARMRIGMSV